MTRHKFVFILKYLLTATLNVVLYGYMKFHVEYTINNIVVEAADWDTAITAIYQWRVRKLRLTNNEIKITDIIPLNN